MEAKRCLLRQRPSQNGLIFCRTVWCQRILTATAVCWIITLSAAFYCSADSPRPALSVTALQKWLKFSSKWMSGVFCCIEKETIVDLLSQSYKRHIIVFVLCIFAKKELTCLLMRIAVSFVKHCGLYGKKLMCLVISFSKRRCN